ncbi:MAG: tetratricopeptide repeat protein [Cyclobacteriaceae bacterium]
MKKIAFILAFVTVTFCLAQTSENKRFKAWLDLARANIGTNPGASRTYLDSIKNHLKGSPSEKQILAETQKMMGTYYYRIGNYDSSIYAYQEAGRLFNEMDSLLDQAKVQVNISMTYARTGDYEPAIKYATEALVLFEKLNDSKGIGIAYNMIGQVYFYNNEFSRARDYFKLYVAHSIDSIELAGGYSNLGSAYERLENYDSALFFVKKSLALHELTGNPYGLGGCHENLGAIYSATGNIRKGIEEYRKAMPYYESVDNKAGLLQVNSNLGTLHKNLKDYRNAEVFASRALEMARVMDEKNIERQSLQDLSEIMEQTGNTPAALGYYKAFHSINDTIFNQETRKNIEQINIAYETQKKTQQIELLSQQNELKEATIQRNVILISALVALLFLGGVLFYLWRRQYRLKQEAVLQEQKVRFRELQINAVIDSQEKERQRFASDLHDGMGQLISALQVNIQSIKLNQHLNDRDQLVETSEHLLTEIRDEIRNIAFNLMPPVLLKEGLVAAVQELARRLNKISDISATFNAYDVPARFSNLAEISLYRIIQELISNILKHASASQISVSITGLENEIVVMIEDDGEGYDLTSFKHSQTGNGWHTIQTRLNLIKGTIHFDTVKGRRNNTTTITLSKNSIVDTKETLEGKYT